MLRRLLLDAVVRPELLLPPLLLLPTFKPVCPPPQPEMEGDEPAARLDVVHAAAAPSQSNGLAAKGLTDDAAAGFNMEAAAAAAAAAV